MVKRRRLAVWLSVFVLIATVAALGLASYSTSAYAAEKTRADYYYGSRLDDNYELAQRIYDAMSGMDFKSGKKFRIDDPLVDDAAARYVRGDKTLLDQFGAAMDCFYYDRAVELFYLDFSKLTLSVLSVNGKYVAEINAGREASYFVEGITADNVQKYIDEYNTELEVFLNEVREGLAARGLTESNVKEHTWTYWNAFCVNDALKNRITYGFCKNSKGEDTVNSPFVRTTYGALVIKECVCEGYSRLFKVAMNELGFKSELIHGAYVHPNGALEPHMWNAVYDETDGAWYGVDATFNDNGGSSAGRYLMVSGSVIDCDHFTDPVVSTSGYEMQYPELVREEIGAESDKLAAFFASENGQNYVKIQYDGLNFARLKQEQGLYIAARFKMGEEWGAWASVEGIAHANGPDNTLMYDKGDYTYLWLYGHQGVGEIEVGVFDRADDSYQKFISKDGYTCYSEESAKNNLVESTGGITNPDYDPTYVMPSFVKNITSYDLDGNVISTAWESSKQDIGKGTVKVAVTYRGALEIADESKPVKVNWWAELPKYDTRSVDMNSVAEYVKVDKVEFKDNVLTFEFTPSPLFQHNSLFYKFTVDNLQTAGSVLTEGQIPVAPKGFGAGFAYADTYICSKCLGGGRYLIDNAYSTPVLVNDSDLSMEGWTYKDGSGREHKVSESQRSNLALVVSKPAYSVQESVDKAVEEQINALELPSEAQTTSATYEVDLNICGAIVNIPDGSYLKINLGFPAGIDYNNLDGVVFKLYHFKRDKNGELDYKKPEEIECIVTPYGLIATVTSFSPYTLLTIKNAPEKLVSSDKGIVADFSGNGGVLESSTGKITDFVKEGETVTYTLKPYEGYSIEYALLNGVPVAVRNGKVTLAYADLESSNIFSCGFVADEVVEAEKEEHVTNALVEFVAAAQLVAAGETVAEDFVVAPIIEGTAETVKAPVLAGVGEDEPETPELPETPADETEGGSGESNNGGESNGGGEQNNGGEPEVGNENDKPEKNIGLIVGLSVGGAVVVIAAIALVVTLLLRKKKQSK